MKKATVTLCMAIAWLLVYSVGFFTDWNVEIVAAASITEADVDVDYVVMESKQTKVLAVEQSSEFDFGILPVFLAESGTFSLTLARTGTYGEVVFLSFIGFGEPGYDLNVAQTPVTIKVKSSMEEDWGMGVIMFGILSSPEPGPYNYNIKLDF